MLAVRGGTEQRPRISTARSALQVSSSDGVDSTGVRRNWVCLVIAEPEGVLKLTACSHARLRGDRFPSAGAATVREWFAEPRDSSGNPGTLDRGLPPAALSLVDRHWAVDFTGVRRDWVCLVFCD